MKVNRRVIQTEQELSELLDDMYQAAKSGDSFFGIAEMLFNKEAIITAMHNIKSNQGSKTTGLDGKTIDDYLQMNKEELFSLIQSQVIDYKPQPVKRVYIPKNNIKSSNKSEMRPLGIPNMIDRIIQELVRMFIEPIVEAQFYNHSYGFRPYRGAEHALARMRDVTRRSQTYWVVEGDIKGYFDNINHNKLLEILWNMGIKDKRILAIVKKMLKAGYIEDGIFHKTTKGTPQGGIISPLLANVYLNGFDWLIAKEYEYHPFTDRYKERRAAYQALKAKGHEPTYLVRYADDWVILTASRENAERLLSKANKYLKHQLKLDLSKEKTLITDMRMRPVTFLSYDLKVGTTKDGRDAPMIYPNSKAVNKALREAINIARKLRYSPDEKWLAVNIERTNEVLVGISEYFNKGISKKVLSKMDNKLFWTTIQSLKSFYRYGKLTEVKNNHCVQLNMLGNRISRHKNYSGKTLAVKVDGIWIGFTRCDITPVKYSQNFNQQMTPYTQIGRKMYAEKMERSSPLTRPSIYRADELYRAMLSSNRLYNFEFYMNRDYAFNRDRGKCRVCGRYLWGINPQCHHINPYLPLNKVNKVRNLASVCPDCHRLVHNEESIDYCKEAKEKLEKFRSTLAEAKKEK